MLKTSFLLVLMLLASFAFHDPPKSYDLGISDETEITTQNEMPELGNYLSYQATVENSIESIVSLESQANQNRFGFQTLGQFYKNLPKFDSTGKFLFLPRYNIIKKYFAMGRSQSLC